MDKTDKLEACPCNSATELRFDLILVGNWIQVVCDACGRRGAHGGSQWMAANLWNQDRSRASVAAPPPDTLNEPCGYCNGTRKEVAGYDGRIVPCAYCTGDQAALHWPFTPKHDNCIECAREYEPPPSPVAATVDAGTFQSRVHPWMMECFGAEIAGDKEERNHRFLEEALELVQACGATRSEAHQLVDYTFDRPVGSASQEVGGVMVTLAALCLAQGFDMHNCGEVELARIWTKVDVIRSKQAAKPKHSPLPVHLPAPSDSSIQARHYFCSCGGALTAEEYIEHYFEKGHDRGEPELLIKAAAAEIVKRFDLVAKVTQRNTVITDEIVAILSKHLGSAAVGGQDYPELDTDDDYALIAEAINLARRVQEFIWKGCYPALRPYDSEGWRRLFQKRVDCLAEVDLTRHGGLAALRKRLLQQAALSIKALVLVNRWVKSYPLILATGSDGSDLLPAATPTSTEEGKEQA